VSDLNKIFLDANNKLDVYEIFPGWKEYNSYTGYDIGGGSISVDGNFTKKIQNGAYYGIGMYTISGGVEVWKKNLSTSSGFYLSKPVYDSTTDRLYFVVSNGLSGNNIYGVDKDTGGGGVATLIDHNDLGGGLTSTEFHDISVDSSGYLYLSGNGVIASTTHCLVLVKLSSGLSVIDYIIVEENLSGAGTEITRDTSIDVGFIGGVERIVVGFDGELGDDKSNIRLYTLSLNKIWSQRLTPFIDGIINVNPEYYGSRKVKIFGDSQDILVLMSTPSRSSGRWQYYVGGQWPDPPYQYYYIRDHTEHLTFDILYRINGGNGSTIWSSPLMEVADQENVNPATGIGNGTYDNSAMEYFDDLDYDDLGNIWVSYYQDYNDNSSSMKKISGSTGSSSSNIFTDPDYFEDGGNVIIQGFEEPISETVTSEPTTTTTQEPLPCEVSNLFEYGYIEKDGIRILIRKTSGNELKLIRPIPPEWIVGTELKLVPGCNKTPCDCLYKWNNINNFLGLGIKMPNADPLTADTGANPG